MEGRAENYGLPGKGRVVGFVPGKSERDRPQGESTGKNGKLRRSPAAKMLCDYVRFLGLLLLEIGVEERISGGEEIGLEDDEGGGQGGEILVDVLVGKL